MADRGRVLVYVEHFRLSGEGAENDAVLLCRALASRGWDVHVAAEDAATVEGVTTHPGALDNLREVRHQVQPDVTLDWGFFGHADLHRLVGAPQESFLPYAQLARGRLGALVHRLTHGRRDRSEIASERELLMTPGERWLAITTFVRRLTLAAGAAPEAVSVLHPGVDLERFSPARCAELRDDVRQKLGLKPAEFAFLFIAHNLKLKNLSRAQRLVAALRQDRLPARLILVGKRCPKRWPNSGIYVETTPRIEAMYAAADALLNPTWFDTFSNVVFEAMACGKPVVTSDLAGVIDFVRSEQNGIVLPVKGPRHQVDRQWLQAVRRLMRDREWGEALGQAARTTAEQRPFDRYLDEMEAELRAVMARRRGAARDRDGE